MFQCRKLMKCSSIIQTGNGRKHLPSMSAMVSHALKLGLIEAETYLQTKVFENATLIAQTEGIAPESAHVIAAVAAEALKTHEASRKRVLSFNLSGHGLLDRRRAAQPRPSCP